jgi:hypothetical protein
LLSKIGVLGVTLKTLVLLKKTVLLGYKTAILLRKIATLHSEALDSLSKRAFL